MSQRYSRQIVLPDVGEIGQSRLHAARVVVVGAGGLGCAVLQYMCAAGVGCISILDHDRIEESNLPRQPLYRVSDLGQLKVYAARAALLQANPHVHINAVAERLTPANAARIISDADLVVDAADSFAVTASVETLLPRGPRIVLLPQRSACVARSARFADAWVYKSCVDRSR